MVFLRGVPGVLPATVSVGLATPFRGAARWRAGENGFGGLAMAVLLHWHGSPWPRRHAAARRETPKQARPARLAPMPRAPGALREPNGAPRDRTMPDDCS